MAPLALNQKLRYPSRLFLSLITKTPSITWWLFIMTPAIRDGSGSINTGFESQLGQGLSPFINSWLGLLIAVKTNSQIFRPFPKSQARLLFKCEALGPDPSLPAILAWHAGLISEWHWPFFWSSLLIKLAHFPWRSMMILTFGDDFPVVHIGTKQILNTQMNIWQKMQSTYYFGTCQASVYVVALIKSHNTNGKILISYYTSLSPLEK